MSMFHEFPYRGIVNGNNEGAVTFFHDPIDSKVRLMHMYVFVAVAFIFQHCLSTQK